MVKSKNKKSGKKRKKPVAKFKEFHGPINKEMPKLIKEGRIPLSVAGLMKKRLETLTKSQKVRDTWWNHNFYTGDAAFCNSKGDFKVVLDAEYMQKINPESELSKGALVLPEGLYEKLEGKEFKRKELESYGIVGRPLNKNEAKDNPVWKALSRDKKLLDDYVDAVFTKTKETYMYDKNMRIWMLQAQPIANGRLWCISSLHYGSSAGDHLGGEIYDRLVGIKQ